jgi:hypothetical protein
MEFLDFEQAKRGCRIIEHKLKFEDAWIDEKSLRRFYMVYARTSVLLGEMSKAIELTNEYKALIPKNDSEHYLSLYYFMKGTCYMYLGKKAGIIISVGHLQACLSVQPVVHSQSMCLLIVAEQSMVLKMVIKKTSIMQEAQMLGQVFQAIQSRLAKMTPRTKGRSMSHTHNLRLAKRSPYPSPRRQR